MHSWVGSRAGLEQIGAVGERTGGLIRIGHQCAACPVEAGLLVEDDLEFVLSARHGIELQEAVFHCLTVVVQFAHRSQTGRQLHVDTSSQQDV